MDRRGVALLVVALAATAASFHVVCDLAFDCGCTWFFRGGSAHCDIQVPGPPDCPPCADRGIGALFALGLLGGWWLMARGALAVAWIASSASRRGGGQ